MAELLGQGRPLEELHDQIGAPLVEPGAAKPDQVGVAKLRAGRGLARESLVRAGIVRAEQDLDRDPAALVLGLVDDPHPASTELAHDLIGTDLHEAILPAGKAQGAPRAAGEVSRRVGRAGPASSRTVSHE